MEIETNKTYKDGGVNITITKNDSTDIHFPAKGGVLGPVVTTYGIGYPGANFHFGPSGVNRTLGAVDVVGDGATVALSLADGSFLYLSVEQVDALTEGLAKYRDDYDVAEHICFDV